METIKILVEAVDGTRRTEDRQIMPITLFMGGRAELFAVTRDHQTKKAAHLVHYRSGFVISSIVVIKRMHGPLDTAQAAQLIINRRIEKTGLDAVRKILAQLPTVNELPSRAKA